VRNFRFVSYIDCFDGQHPSVFSPSEVPHRPFTSIEDINNYLLEHKEVVDLIRSRAKDGDAGKAVFLFFDEQTELLCEQLGLEVCFPKAKLRQEIDNKLMTTRIGDRVGIASVPNVLARVQSYEELRRATTADASPWRKSGRANSVWRQRTYDVLHFLRSRLEQTRRRNFRRPRSAGGSLFSGRP
jgi:hypothetical protein